MKTTIILLIVMIFFFSCKGESVTTYCNVKDPKNDLAWLKSEIADFEKLKALASTPIPITMSIWIGNSGNSSKIYIERRQTSYNFRTIDCSGNVICSLTTEKGTCLDDFKNSLSSLSLIYESK